MHIYIHWSFSDYITKDLSILRGPYLAVSNIITFSSALMIEVNQNLCTAAGRIDSLDMLALLYILSIYFIYIK